eukprot:364135-Chlamydomonas_euryale.AAC.3
MWGGEGGGKGRGDIRSDDGSPVAREAHAIRAPVNGPCIPPAFPCMGPYMPPALPFMGHAFRLRSRAWGHTCHPRSRAVAMHSACAPVHGPCMPPALPCSGHACRLRSRAVAMHAICIPMRDSGGGQRSEATCRRGTTPSHHTKRANGGGGCAHVAAAFTVPNWLKNASDVRAQGRQAHTHVRAHERERVVGHLASCVQKCGGMVAGIPHEELRRERETAPPRAPPTAPKTHTRSTSVPALLPHACTPAPAPEGTARVTERRAGCMGGWMYGGLDVWGAGCIGGLDVRGAGCMGGWKYWGAGCMGGGWMCGARTPHA